MTAALSEKLRELRLAPQPVPARGPERSRFAPRPGGNARLYAFVAAALILGLAAGWMVSAYFRGSDAAAAAPPPPVQAASAGEIGSIVATGYVVPRRGGTVGSQMTGQLRQILVKEGDRVAAGQVIARIDDSEGRAALSRARSEASMARSARGALQSQYAAARARLARLETLGHRGFATLAALDESRAEANTLRAKVDEAGAGIAASEANVRNAEVALERHVIRAPFAGVVVAKNAEVGELVSPVSAGGGFTRTGVVTIVDMDSLGVEVDVGEANIRRIHPGQAVALTLDAFPGERFEARLSAIVPAADRNRATVRVDIEFVNRDPRILPQMAAKAMFLQPRSSQGDPS